MTWPTVQCSGTAIRSRCISRPANSSGIGERFLDRGAVVGVELAKDGALLVLLEVLDHGDGVVRLHLAGEVGDLARVERVDQLLADMLVHLGEHVAVEQVGDRRGERPAVVAVDQLEQIGEVGRVERLDQGAGAVGIAGLDPLHHLADIFGLQPVVLVEPALGREPGGAPDRSISLSLIRPLPPGMVSPRRFLGRGDGTVERGGAREPPGLCAP